MTHTPFSVSSSTLDDLLHSGVHTIAPTSDSSFTTSSLVQGEQIHNSSRLSPPSSSRYGAISPMTATHTSFANNGNSTPTATGSSSGLNLLHASSVQIHHHMPHQTHNGAGGGQHAPLFVHHLLGPQRAQQSHEEHQRQHGSEQQQQTPQQYLHVDAAGTCHWVFSQQPTTTTTTATTHNGAVPPPPSSSLQQQQATTDVSHQQPQPLPHAFLQQGVAKQPQQPPTYVVMMGGATAQQPTTHHQRLPGGVMILPSPAQHAQHTHHNNTHQLVMMPLQQPQQQQQIIPLLAATQQQPFSYHHHAQPPPPFPSPTAMLTTLSSPIPPSFLSSSASIISSATIASNNPTITAATTNQPTTATPSKPSLGPCKHFLENRCTWGASCRFEHLDISPTQAMVLRASLHSQQQHQQQQQSWGLSPQPLRNVSLPAAPPPDPEQKKTVMQHVEKLHQQQMQKAAEDKLRPCKDHVEGRCVRGTMCRFSHEWSPFIMRAPTL